jgi:hypothetical protein
MATPARPGPADAGDRDGDGVLSAHGTFRVLIIVIAVWTFFAGFSLLTQGIGRVSFGGDDEAAERTVGAFMLLLVPLYGLMAWKQDEYRLLVWVPFAAQLAIIVPLLWDLVLGTRDLDDSVLLFVVSLIFLVLLLYVWQASGPAGFFNGGGEVDDDDEELLDEDEEYDEEEEEEEAEEPPAGRRSTGAL